MKGFFTALFDGKELANNSNDDVYIGQVANHYGKLSVPDNDDHRDDNHYTTTTHKTYKISSSRQKKNYRHILLHTNE